jgi:hypothetical protein
MRNRPVSMSSRDRLVRDDRSIAITILLSAVTVLSVRVRFVRTSTVQTAHTVPLEHAKNLKLLEPLENIGTLSALIPLTAPPPLPAAPPPPT